MYTGPDKLNEVIDYIERHITEDISCRELARIALLSEYEFRRIFSFFTGTPVAEYIRRRRLSLAAEEIKAGLGTVSAIGAKYGYDSGSSFTRSFKELFSVSPQEARQPEVILSVGTTPRFEYCVRGGSPIAYTERLLNAFSIAGVRGISPLSDTCCCESVWSAYETRTRISGKQPEDVYAAYENGEKDVVCCIGQKVAYGARGSHIDIAAGRWLYFRAEATASDRDINRLYEKILFTFLPASIYSKDTRPNIEVFHPDGSFDIMIPVTVKKPM